LIGAGYDAPEPKGCRFAQVLGAMATGLAAAGGTVWFAAKVFKIGLLMHGKPPSFGTLVKWARLA
jgi:ABC-2 type transport system permease protein